MMNIGEAAQACGISAKMIRYYEQIHLMPPAVRSAAGYRGYSEGDVRRLLFIRRARDLGFPVAEIRGLLELWADQSRQSAHVKRLAQQHIDHLEQRILDLRQMADSLQAMMNRCAGDERPDCPILSGLERREAQAGDAGGEKGAGPVSP